MSLQKNKRCADVALSSDSVDSSNITAVYPKLVPGDILLTQTYGFFYSLWRRLSCTMYDHSAVVLENEETLNVVYPVAKKLPASHFFRSGKSPMVLRPAWRSERQLAEFLRAMHRLEGTRYNLFRGVFNISNAMMYHRLGLKIPLKVPEITDKKWVCTDAIIIYLQNSMPEFSKIKKLDLDLFRFGFTTLNDFMRIAYYMPDLLKKVE
jgi:hypothetical protein